MCDGRGAGCSLPSASGLPCGRRREGLDCGAGDRRGSHGGRGRMSCWAWVHPGAGGMQRVRRRRPGLGMAHGREGRGLAGGGGEGRAGSRGARGPVMLPAWRSGGGSEGQVTAEDGLYYLWEAAAVGWWRWPVRKPEIADRLIDLSSSYLFITHLPRCLSRKRATSPRSQHRAKRPPQTHSTRCVLAPRHS